MRVYEATNLTAKSRVIEGHESQVRPRFVFHDQHTRLGIELEYCRQFYDSNFAHGRDHTLVARLPLWRPIGNATVNHQRVMTQLHPRTVTDLSSFVNFLLSATPSLTQCAV